MKPAPKPAALGRHLAPRQKLWLNWDGVFLMGPNYLRFLAAVDQTGTIREGGRAVGWSYRTCLNRLRRMERVLGAPVLATTRGGRTGGGARLTPEARRLVKVFARWQREVERMTRKAFDEALRGLMLGVLLCVTAGTAAPAKAQTSPTGALVVFNAGSLAKPFNDLLRAFRAKHPGVVPAQENSGSLEAARKLTELGKIPDLLAVADYDVIPKLLFPKFASWYALFARTSMVLAYTDKSTGASEINVRNWWRVLQRPDVRSGHSEPALDPAGYRSLMVFQLAEHYYRQPGLAARLAAAIPSRNIRPKSAELIALVQVGELDYAWEYEAVAKRQGLRYVALPAEINLGDTRLSRTYAKASVRLPGASRSGSDSVEFSGAPIAYALTIPKAAPNPSAARAFVRFIFSPEGQAIIEDSGFMLLEKPVLGGPGKPPAGLF